MISPPMASRPLRTRVLGGSKGRCRHPPSHPNSWEWRAMLPLLSMNSWMTRLRATAPASATWHLAIVRPGSALWRTLRDSHRWLWNIRRLTPLRTHVRGASHLNLWEWRAMHLPLSKNSRMTRVRATAPASATWHLATVRPGSALWRTLRGSRRSLRSLRKLTPLRTRVRGLSRLREGTWRNYDNGGRASRRLRRQARCSTLRHMRITQRATPEVTPARSNTTS